MRKKMYRGFAVWEACVVYVVFWLIMISLVSIWTNRNLDFWVSYSKGVVTNVPYWKAWLCSIPFPLTFVANIVGEVARLFV